MDTTSLPSSLKVAREIAQLTQDDLAARIGVTRAAVSQWEVGASLPGGPARRLLAQLFEVPLEVVEAWFAQPKAEAAA
jgi:DNA-binding transcriptional regulator YiaG